MSAHNYKGRTYTGRPITRTSQAPTKHAPASFGKRRPKPKKLTK